MNIKIALLSSLFLITGSTQCGDFTPPPVVKLEEIKYALLQYIGLPVEPSTEIEEIKYALLKYVELTDIIENSSEQENYNNAVANRHNCASNLIEEINKCRDLSNCSNLQNAFYTFNKAELKVGEEWNNLQNSEHQKKLNELQKKYQYKNLNLADQINKAKFEGVMPEYQ